MARLANGGRSLLVLTLRRIFPSPLFLRPLLNLLSFLCLIFLLRLHLLFRFLPVLLRFLVFRTTLELRALALSMPEAPRDQTRCR